MSKSKTPPTWNCRLEHKRIVSTFWVEHHASPYSWGAFQRFLRRCRCHKQPLQDKCTFSCFKIIILGLLSPKSPKRHDMRFVGAILIAYDGQTWANYCFHKPRKSFQSMIHDRERSQAQLCAVCSPRAPRCINLANSARFPVAVFQLESSWTEDDDNASKTIKRIPEDKRSTLIVLPFEML